MPQGFFTKFPKTINRVKLLDNRDRNRVNSEIQSGRLDEAYDALSIGEKATLCELDLHSRSSFAGKAEASLSKLVPKADLRSAHRVLVGCAAASMRYHDEIRVFSRLMAKSVVGNNQ